MSKLNLNNYTDREILSAFFTLPAQKFLSIMHGMTEMMERMKSRGKIIARADTDEMIDEVIRRIQEGEDI